MRYIRKFSAMIINNFLCSSCGCNKVPQAGCQKPANQPTNQLPPPATATTTIETKTKAKKVKKKQKQAETYFSQKKFDIKVTM